jgi:hypothetical protein
MEPKPIYDGTLEPLQGLGSDGFYKDIEERREREGRFRTSSGELAKKGHRIYGGNPLTDAGLRVASGQEYDQKLGWVMKATRKRASHPFQDRHHLPDDKLRYWQGMVYFKNGRFKRVSQAQGHLETREITPRGGSR